MVEGYWGHEEYSGGVDVRGPLEDTPEGLGIDVCDSNVNEDGMYWGKVYGSGEPVIVKDGSAEFGNAVPGNLLSYELFSDTEVNVPDVGYSAERDEIYMEVLEGYDGKVSALDEGRQEEFLRHVAAKALIGDSDFMHNIGKLDDGYAMIDPDKAGAPMHTFEEGLFDYIEMINSGTVFNISRQDFRGVLRSLAGEVGEEQLETSLDRLQAFKDDIPAYANFEPEFVRDNFRAAQEGSAKMQEAERPAV